MDGEISWTKTGRTRTSDGYRMLVEPTSRIGGLVPASVERRGVARMTFVQSVDEGRAWCAETVNDMRQATEGVDHGR